MHPQFLFAHSLLKWTTKTLTLNFLLSFHHHGSRRRRHLHRTFISFPPATISVVTAAIETATARPPRLREQRWKPARLRNTTGAKPAAATTMELPRAHHAAAAAPPFSTTIAGHYQPAQQRATTMATTETRQKRISRSITIAQHHLLASIAPATTAPTGEATTPSQQLPHEPCTSLQPKEQAETLI